MSHLARRLLEISLSLEAKNFGASIALLDLPHGTEIAQVTPWTSVTHWTSTQQPWVVLIVEAKPKLPFDTREQLFCS